jgi:hypothetical protein
MKKSPVSATDIKKPAVTKFDPFNNRLSRDIRNALSEAFMAALERMEPAAYRDEADGRLVQNPPAILIAYIQDRLQRYDRVLEQIREGALSEPLLQSLVLWNHGLFFEFHDLLEGIWKPATGDNRQALKGLIKAAGVYIHYEYDHRQPVTKLAAKSYNLIRQYSHCLGFIENLDALLQALKTPDSNPPRLENPALRQD